MTSVNTLKNLICPHCKCYMQEIEVNGFWWLKCPACGFMKETGKYKWENTNLEGKDDFIIK
jgi:phage FluMu protein Com